MKNTKLIILTSALTSLATHVLLSSWIFWLILILSVWLYLGYLGNIMDDDKSLDPIIILGLLFFFISLIGNAPHSINRLWSYFFSKPLPRLRSPFVFDKEEN